MINFPLRSRTTKDLYSWRRDALYVASTFGVLDHLNEHECTVERMMANLAAAVAADLPYHRRHVGPADCPFFIMRPATCVQSPVGSDSARPADDSSR